MNLKSITCVLALALSLPCTTAIAASAGQITLLTGRATAASPEGTIRNLNKGDSVYSREFVSTSNNSFVNIKFADGGAVLIKPNSRFHIEQFSYAGAASKTDPVKPGVKPESAQRRVAGSTAFFRLLKGGFRAVSGLIGKRDRNEYRVSTPVATIGIRGTDYEIILCDDNCVNDPVIMERVGITTDPQDGLVASVLDGGIGVTTKDAATVSSLRTYRAIAQALHLQPAGLVKTAHRPRFLKMATNGQQTYNVDKGQTFFFPKSPNQPPVKLPGVTPNIDSGLNQYSPQDICK